MSGCRKAVLFSGFLLCADPAAAQRTAAVELPHSTDKIEVRISACGRMGEPIALVLDGDESNRVEAERTAPGIWTGHATKTFDAAHSTASIRYGSGRTACVRSRPARQPADPNKWVAVFVFACLEEPTWKSLQIAANSEMVPMQVVRFMPAQGTGTVPCEDKLFRKGGGVDVMDVAPLSESVYIHFGMPPEQLHYEFYHLRVREGLAGKKVIHERGTKVNTAEIAADWAMRSRNGANESKILQLELGQRFKSATLKKVK